MSLSKEIIFNIENFLSEKDIIIDNWIVEVPKDKKIADYATNIAFKLSPILKSSPIKIAEDLLPEINNSFNNNGNFNFEIFSLKGFINFKLKPSFCFDYLKKNSFGKNLIKTKDKILLEYVSANPTGPLHIGHGRWAALGDSLQRIMKHVGFNVSTEFYVNDAGNQINLFLDSIKATKEGKELPENGYAGEYVKTLINSENPVDDILSQQKETLKKIDVIFDDWFSEKKELHEKNHLHNIIQTMIDNNLTYTKDGALFFHSTIYGDDKDRVLIKSDNAYTYFSADIAYHKNKIERTFNHLINIWGADHHGYIKRIQAVISALFGENIVFEVILGQLVSLFRDGEEVKMSKRTGEMITLEEIIEEIGSDATRFFLVSKPSDTRIDFDLELAKKKSNDNPVYYVQYAHARISSILSSVELSDFSFAENISLQEIEISLLRFLVHFEDELLLSAQKREPHRLATYLIELSNIFHTFYHQCKVISDDQKINASRVEIIKLTKKILSTGLGLLGISSPEKM
jgi:arginyl-tRNA synthetase